MNAEAFIGFNAFNTQKITGNGEIDFLEYRRQLANLTPYPDLISKVIGEPKK